MSLTELTDLEQALLRELAAGPRKPGELTANADRPTVDRALARLEDLGATRMAGSNDGGPWILTADGQALLCAALPAPSPTPRHSKRRPPNPGEQQ